MRFLRALLKGKGKGGRRRGSVLVYTLIMLTLACIATYVVVTLANRNLRVTQQAESRLRAFYAAEAGVDQVTDWFNRAYFSWLYTQVVNGDITTVVDPSTLHTWDKNNNPFNDATFQAYFKPWETGPDAGKFMNEAGQSSFGRDVNGSDLPVLTIDNRDGGATWGNFLPVLNELIGHNAGTGLGQVTYVRITRAPQNTNGIIAYVSVLGVNPSDAEVTVQCALQRPWIPSITAPAALMGQEGVSSSGQINVHWGQVWTHGNYEVTKINGKGALPNPDAPYNDKWIKVLSESNVLSKYNDVDPTDPLKNALFCDGLSAGGTRSDPVPSDSVNYYQPYKDILQNDGKAQQWASYTDVLYQHQTLNWPEYDYAHVKALVARLGYPIYKTNADGTLTGPDPNDPTKTITDTFDNIFNVSGTLQDPDNINWDVMPPLYFIDTTDGNPPAADGSNVVPLKDAGQKPLYYGLFFMAANMTFGGAGNSVSLDNPELPDRTIGQSIANCRFAGLLYSYGQVSFGGQGDLYGAVYAKKGFVGSGSWDVYYDWRMADPLRNMISSRVIRATWDTYNGEPTDINDTTGSGS